MKKHTITFEATAEQVVKIVELLNAAIDHLQGIDDRYETANVIIGALPVLEKKTTYDEAKEERA